MSQALPLVSVIIPVYNGRSTIDLTLKSVFAQTWRDFECIIVDDGSRDDLASFIREHWPQVRYVHQQNQGVSAARNTGIEHARGTLLAFQDSDDYWMPTKLEEQVKVFHENPQVAFAFTKVVFMVKDFHEAAPKFADKAHLGYRLHTTLDRLLDDPFLATASVMVKADLAREIGGFDRTLVTAEDIDFYLKACNGRVYAEVISVLTLKGDHEDSLGSKMRSYLDCFYVLDRFRKEHPQVYSKNPAIDSNVRMRSYLSWINELLYRGLGAEARRVLAEAQKVRPVPRRNKLFFKSFYCHLTAGIKGRRKPIEGLYK